MLRGSVLLETAKCDLENHRSFLFADPLGELTAWAEDEIDDAFSAIDEHLRQGHFVAGFASYECGASLNGIALIHPKPVHEVPLLRMGVFRAPTVFNHQTGVVTGPHRPDAASDEEQAAEILHADLQIDTMAYQRQVRTIQNHLAAGHSYQVNFTDSVAGDFTGTPLALYMRVLAQQPVPYAALLNNAGRPILSFSPELFYCVREGRIQARPMKGTWPRGRNRAEDDDAARSLFHDEKNRAEHTTIVDLLRNDLGRVCELGSVTVDTLMRVERYSTLHQMTSNISGTLRPHLTAGEVFQTLFPSGSITGAPKRRTMQIIQELESTLRGVYTGSIGYFSPNGDACFNVAIRTLLVENNTFVLGVGGGITVDSTAEAEYEECRLKASFLTRQKPEFCLFETMLGVANSIPRLEAHLRRIGDSAVYFGIPCDEAAMRYDLQACLSEADASKHRVRLVLSQDGRWTIEMSPLKTVRWLGKVMLWPEPVQASDGWLQHKTTNRELYRRALSEAHKNGFDEVLFQNEEGMVTEGAISNLFAHIQGKIITPDTVCGLLPGVERADLLVSHPEVEIGLIPLSNLCHADDVRLCNALRGSRTVNMIADTQGKTLWRREQSAP